MTPTAIIVLVKDALIILALGFVVYLLISYGKDIVKIADIKAVEKQLVENAKTQADWRKEQIDAEQKRTNDLSQVAAAIGQQHTPVILRSSPSVCPMSSDTKPSSSSPSIERGTGQGPGEDLRPQINAFELKYEAALADCRAVLDQWPINQK